MHSLALLYEKRGQRDKALELYDRCIKLQSQHIGMNHQDALVTLQNAAVSRKRMCDYHGACENYKAAAEGYEAIYSLAHPKTLEVLQQLRIMYRRLGQFADARKVAERIAEGNKALES
jgi:tetratricopeptide (TPR) repeat protein